MRERVNASVVRCPGSGMSIAQDGGPPEVDLLLRSRRSAASRIRSCSARSSSFSAYSAVRNAADNLARAKIASGFGFWNQTAGFDISQTLIEYTAQSGTYGRAFWVGLINTLLIAVLGIFFATIVGFLVGIARLSKNWLIGRLASAMSSLSATCRCCCSFCSGTTRCSRRCPICATAGPSAASSSTIAGSSRPRPYSRTEAASWPEPSVVGVVGAIAYRSWAQKKQEKTGQQSPVLLVALGLIIGLPLIAFFIAGMPVTLEYPEKGRFNIRGGVEILPELVALLIGLVIYTGAFIAEVVRAGILAVSRGQTEAAGALGLRTGPTLKLVVIPQAMRVIIPPLTNQYLNLTKNSSLAVFVGYPDLVQIFTGTVLNQTGQAVEVVVITMAVYLTISLVTSLVMNWYNSRIALVER